MSVKAPSPTLTPFIRQTLCFLFAIYTCIVSYILTWTGVRALQLEELHQLGPGYAMLDPRFIGIYLTVFTIVISCAMPLICLGELAMRMPHGPIVPIKAWLARREEAHAQRVAAIVIAKQKQEETEPTTTFKESD